MPVTPADVRHAALLARLHLEEEEQERMAAQLMQIVEHVDRLRELDTTGIEPMASPQSDTFTPLRPDRIAPSLDREDVLAGAPERHGPYVQVPKMIDE